MQYAKEILYLLEEDKWKLPLITLFFLIMSLLEVLGISLIAPYAALIINPNILSEKYIFLANFLIQAVLPAFFELIQNFF